MAQQALHPFGGDVAGTTQQYSDKLNDNGNDLALGNVQVSGIDWQHPDDWYARGTIEGYRQ